VSENVKEISASGHVQVGIDETARRGSPSRPVPALVAVLDALGASVYSREEAEEFLEARSEIMKLLEDVAADSFKIVKDDLSTFIFNDSIILAYARRNGLTSDDINGFCGLLRAFEVAFLLKRILFRGAVSFGELYRVDPERNTVMGPAVSDAAAWYERADWVGIHVTPRTTVLIRSSLQEHPSALDHVLVDYPVPLAANGTMNLKAINWPKGLYLQFEPRDSKKAKSTLLKILGGMRSLPAGAESKYFHAIEFFDHCAAKTS
jgi:predicted nucleic acid-binding protein